MAKLGVGVIGVGEMGRQHAHNIARLIPDARLVAIADANLEVARSVARSFEVERYYGSADELVAQSDLQAVVIASPPKFHPEGIRSAAAAGKHILCEKPLALTLEEADAALEAAQKAGVGLQVGFMRRYDPAYAQAQQRIEAGDIGEPVLFKSIGRDAEAPPDIYFESGYNGTLFHDSSVHDFDLARWLMQDEVAEVHAFAGSSALPHLRKLGLFDSGVVNLRFTRGGIGNVESFADARYGYDVRTEIIGTQGTLQVGTLEDVPLLVLNAHGGQSQAVRHFLVRFAEAYVQEMRDFVDAVLSERVPRVSGEDGRRALAIVLAAVRSVKESRAVQVETSAARATSKVSSLRS